MLDSIVFQTFRVSTSRPRLGQGVRPVRPAARKGVGLALAAHVENVVSGEPRKPQVVKLLHKRHLQSDSLSPSICSRPYSQAARICSGVRCRSCGIRAASRSVSVKSSNSSLATLSALLAVFWACSAAPGQATTCAADGSKHRRARAYRGCTESPAPSCGRLGPNVLAASGQ